MGKRGGCCVFGEERAKTKGGLMQLSVIQNKIYEIRGHKVMLDRDLASMYEVETRILNQAPADFMFQLTEKEFENWKSQIVISNSEKMGFNERISQTAKESGLKNNGL